jgi:hypothetical protein
MFLPDLNNENMNIKDELIRYAKWYDKATMPEDAQTDNDDLEQNVDSYLQTEGKNIVLSAVSGTLPSPDESKKAMLKRKIKFVDNMDKFSSRKNAYKKGWQDCYNWMMSKGNDR